MHWSIRRRTRDFKEGNKDTFMCGITGIFDTRGRRDIDRSVLTRMNESQHHRGPDEGGLHVEPGVGLGHRRLSIIDLSTGQQPLYNEDRAFVWCSTARSTTTRN
jgi:asparagine synthetase B (glutamine-hydrolysing)